MAVCGPILKELRRRADEIVRPRAILGRRAMDRLEDPHEPRQRRRHHEIADRYELHLHAGLGRADLVRPDRNRVEAPARERQDDLQDDDDHHRPDQLGVDAPAEDFREGAAGNEMHIVAPPPSND